MAQNFSCGCCCIKHINGNKFCLQDGRNLFPCILFFALMMRKCHQCSPALHEELSSGRGFDHRKKKTQQVERTPDPVQVARNHATVSTSRRRQIPSDGAAEGRRVGGREAGRRGEASVERAAASRINITARRSALPSCPILPLLPKLACILFQIC